jgi:hypothetical protein
VRELARYLEEGMKETFMPIAAAEKKEYYPLASAQKHLVVMQHMEQDSTVYNMQVVLNLEGDVQIQKIGGIFQRLTRRHEILRTAFGTSSPEPRQQVLGEVAFRAEYHAVTLNGVIPGDGENGGVPGRMVPGETLTPLIRDLVSDFIRPFDLACPPLFRVGLFRLGPLRHLLVMDIHHIIFDMVSAAILLRNFLALYRDKALPPLRLHYKDYAQWQQALAASPGMKRQEAYWLEQFSGEIPLLELPVEATGQAGRDFAGEVIYFELDRETTAAIKGLAIEQEVTLFMVLLALYTILLGKVSDREEVIVGSPAAGRRHADLEPLVGFFVNTLALRNFPRGDSTFSGFLADVKARTLAAYENQDYPFEELVNRVWDTGHSRRFSFISAFLALQDTGGAYAQLRQLTLPGLTVTPYLEEIRKSPFEIILNCVDPGEVLAFQLIYQTALFTGETAARLVGHFRRLAASAAADRDVRLEEISLCHGLLQASAEMPAEEGDFGWSPGGE